MEVQKPGELDLTGRSLMDVFTFLSRYVEAPDEHRKQGLVEECAVSTWDFAGPCLSVRSSPTKPAKAFVAIPYRDHWFYVPDDDLAG
ncbi:MAG: hypothetical protein AAF585_12080 [Verrucomicrobiota bacterium]